MFEKGDSILKTLIPPVPSDPNDIEIPVYPVQYHIWSTLNKKF